jgi:hypothetical protein
VPAPVTVSHLVHEMVMLYDLAMYTCNMVVSFTESIRLLADTMLKFHWPTYRYSYRSFLIQRYKMKSVFEQTINDACNLVTSFLDGKCCTLYVAPFFIALSSSSLFRFDRKFDVLSNKNRCLYHYLISSSSSSFMKIGSAKAAVFISQDKNIDISIR